jgi:hypothetical protein
LFGKNYCIGNRKVAIVGTGYVGSSIAYALALRDIAREIVLIDVNKEKAEGEAQDIRHGISSMGTSDLYAGDYSDCRDCDLIVITAGRNRRPGETRLDMAEENVRIMKSVIDSLKEYYTKGVILLISNPVDILTQKVSEWMELPNGMVFGSGCILDTSEFIRQVHDFIMSLPNGYDTPVGELGDTLSGGERQRLGLARAFLHDAPFLLLDEPTSNLDSLNEAVILKSLREEQNGKTIALVSHRESTMRIADSVYSVEHGRVS